MFLEKEGKVYEEYIAYSTKIWKFALRHKFALQRMVNSNGYNSGTFKDARVIAVRSRHTL